MAFLHGKHVLAGLMAGLFVACAAPAAAQQAGGTPGGLALQAGMGDDYQRYMLGYETPTLWSYRFGGDWGRLDLTGELAVSYWHADSGHSPSSLWQLGATPMLRWWLGERFYVEGGVGANVFSRTTFADKTISTAFQFGDHIGLGFQLTQSARIGVRYSHFSNANIKKPNPGLDVVQLTYVQSF